MEIRVVAVEVHDEVMYGPTGLVGRWATSVARELKSAAIAEAPTGATSGRVNKSRANAHEPVGSLKKGIRSATSRTGPHSLDIELISTASYSLYVLKGTHSPIIAKSARIPKGQPGAGQFASLEEGGGMYLPGNPGWGKSKMRQRVSGQRPNRFIDRAVATVGARHSSIRGFRMN